MTMPGFHADVGLAARRGRYLSGVSVERDVHAGAEIGPSAILVWTGHCGCPADQWFGLPCVCYDVVPDPPLIVPDPDAHPL